MNKFGERLRELRTDNCYSRAQLAKNLNVSARLIAYWENGQRECSFDTLISIAELFGTSTDFLLGKSDY
ncbi:MAG: helix-turn-helix domain-containing protein [Clostridia bacterium]|nr:helix-turn-helix domain-containing protein [Clostridia bacterium]